MWRFPYELQHITLSTLMSSAVAYLCHFKGCVECITWDKLNMFIHLAFGGWESRRCLYMLPDHTIEDQRRPCDLLQLTPDICHTITTI